MEQDSIVLDLDATPGGFSILDRRSEKEDPERLEHGSQYIEPRGIPSVDHLMVRSRAWVISVAIHGAFLAGAAAMAFQFPVFFDEGAAGAGIWLELRAPGILLDRIERRRDEFSHWGVLSESSFSLSEGGFAGSRADWGDGNRDADIDMGTACGWQVAGLGIAAWVMRVEDHFVRRKSISQSRARTPRLKVARGRRALHLLGLEVVCSCRDTLQSPDARD